MSAKALKIGATSRRPPPGPDRPDVHHAARGHAVLQARGRGDGRPVGVARASGCSCTATSRASNASATRSITASTCRATASVVQRQLLRRGSRHVQGRRRGRAQGPLSGEGFQVERNGVMAKCPSKYEPSKGATPENLGRCAAPQQGSQPMPASRKRAAPRSLRDVRVCGRGVGGRRAPPLDAAD